MKCKEKQYIQRTDGQKGYNACIRTQLLGVQCQNVHIDV